jgi:GNAT superfamily N-acetyltransferase
LKLLFAIKYMIIEPLSCHPDRVVELAGLLNEEWFEFAPWSDRERIEKRFVEAASGAAYPKAFLALNDDAVVGTASIKLRALPHHPDRLHWLDEVFVVPDYRGQGIARGLIDAAVDYARNLLAEDLFLYTPDKQALYERLGWAEVDQDQVNGERVSIMVRRL